MVFSLSAVDYSQGDYEISFAQFTQQAQEKYSQNMINDKYLIKNELGVYYQFYTGTENKLSENIPTKEDMEAFKDGISDYTTEFSSLNLVGWKLVVIDGEGKATYCDLTYDNIQNNLTEEYGLNAFTAIAIVEKAN